MKVIETPLKGLLIVELDIYRDDRGYFVERFQAEKFAKLGLPNQFVQDNQSYSRPGVIRGLHFQVNPGQGKLVGCTRGRIHDVAVDLRRDSATFGKSFSTELSAENGRLLWIPGDFAHGFCVLGAEPADVSYKVDSFYDPGRERGIVWNDPELGISWPVSDPILTPKDRQLPPFRTLFPN